MKRRDFLKLGVTTGIAAIVPIHFIIDNRDAETRFLEYAINNYNEMQVLCLIKEYGFLMSRGKITTFFTEFTQRQPEVVKWLKERIVINKHADGSSAYSSEEYFIHKRYPYKCAYNEWARKEYDTFLSHKFDLPKPRTPYNKEWYDSIYKEIAEDNPELDMSIQAAERKRLGLT